MIKEPQGPTPRIEAIQDQLQRLENLLNTSIVTGEPITRACISCFQILEDETCACERPLFWPIHLVIARIKAEYGS